MRKQGFEKNTVPPQPKVWLNILLSGLKLLPAFVSADVASRVFFALITLCYSSPFFFRAFRKKSPMFAFIHRFRKQAGFSRCCLRFVVKNPAKHLCGILC